jgi:hypothetical protein
VVLEGTPVEPTESTPVVTPVVPEVCPPEGDCASVFDRVVVNYLIAGGTRVMWELRDDFVDPMPFTFQLQVGQTDSNDADDWEDVGLAVTNMYVAYDDAQRAFNRAVNRTFYRIKLTTGLDVYYSEPTASEGTLDFRDWRLAADIVRGELVRFREDAGQRGLLLKRRITGEDCPVCLDYQTQEVRDPECPDCWGTGKKCGYFFPIDCVWADMDPKTYRTHLDGTRGTVNDVVLKARMLNTVLLGEEDVWVNLKTDDRYYVHTVQNVAERRGVPLIAKVELRPAPFTDIIYEIPIPQQLEYLGLQ